MSLTHVHRSSFNITHADDLSALSRPRADLSSIRNVVLNGAVTPSWDDIELLFAKCLNLEELTIRNFTIVDTPRRIRPLPTNFLRRLNISYTPGRHHETSINALWTLPDVHNLPHITVWLGPLNSPLLEEIIYDLVEFVTTAFFWRTATVDIHMDNGLIDITTTTQYDDTQRRTLHLFDPVSTARTQAADIMDMVRAGVATALQMIFPSHEGSSSTLIKPLHAARRIRIPLSLVPFMLSHSTTDAPYFVGLEELEIDWDVDVNIVASNVARFVIPSRDVTQPRIIRVRRASSVQRFWTSARVLLTVLNTTKERPIVELHGFGLTTHYDLSEVRAMCSRLVLVD
ncbi:hypothetical protein EXIGLDRAFT_807962 [Exidia glandulosa HHB12029]|uniref:F-box domain-containing protein n=1 Tax=Exidia glandulosa HHB12029 TaxID=1314781 RepID=A0A165D4P4_EXIGL|nr:hypothetical protein EXIGLDRAFT_807962 [Exidia glandulosa HHB12029]